MCQTLKTMNEKLLLKVILILPRKKYLCLSKAENLISLGYVTAILTHFFIFLKPSTLFS